MCVYICFPHQAFNPVSTGMSLSLIEFVGNALQPGERKHIPAEVTSAFGGGL